MVDFSKHVGKKADPRPLDPLAIYEKLDRASDKGPLRPVQEAVLAHWHKHRRVERDLIVKLHTGQGKTLIGLLLLQSKLNEKRGPALYLCANNFLVAQTCEQAKQFGITICTAGPDRELPPEFFDSRAILITSVHKLFNGHTKFGLGAKSQEVGALVMDDAHACIDAIREQTGIALGADSQPYRDLLELFGNDLEQQSIGRYADLRRGEYSAILPVPYWAWGDKLQEVANILSKNSEMDEITFAWPLLRDVLPECQCVISGTGLEIHPYLAPLDRIGSYSRAKHRYFMSATVTEDSFLVKGLGISPDVIRKPLVYEKEKWSGEKMILIPSLIDPSLTREVIVESFAKPAEGRTYGVVALAPSFEGCQDWRQYGAVVAERKDIDDRVRALQDGKAYKAALVIVNRYDGIDLPDQSCRVLVFDSKPFSESLLDRYLESCLENSEAIVMKTARKIEQGLGRSVRGEKDYSAIIMIGPDLVKQVRSTLAGFFSAQTRTQVEIGLQIAEMATRDIDEGTDPKKVLQRLIQQLLKRDEGWKEFYEEKMDQVPSAHGSTYKRLDLFAEELKAERAALDGEHEKAAKIIQRLIDDHVRDDAERGYYLQEMARHLYRVNKVKSGEQQVAAHRKNHYLLKPQAGMEIQRMQALGQKRTERIIDWVKAKGDFATLIVNIEDILGSLRFGVGHEKFEQALHLLGRALGFGSQRPDKEWGQGPDNLWALRDGEYVQFEAKSEVSPDRAEINKYEAEQANQAEAWFREKRYGGNKVTTYLVIPPRKLASGATLTFPTKIMRKKHLAKVADRVRAFFMSFKDLDFGDLSPAKVHESIEKHGLSVEEFRTAFGDDPYSAGN